MSLVVTRLNSNWQPLISNYGAHRIDDLQRATAQYHEFVRWQQQGSNYIYPISEPSFFESLFKVSINELTISTRNIAIWRIFILNEIMLIALEGNDRSTVYVSSYWSYCGISFPSNSPILGKLFHPRESLLFPNPHLTSMRCLAHSVPPLHSHQSPCYIVETHADGLTHESHARFAQ